MKHTILPATGLALVLAACSGGVQIQTLATPGATGTAAAASAAADERDLAGRSVVRTSVSVLPFDVTTTDSSFAPLGYGFAELLLTDLAVSHQLTVVDRMHTSELHQELALSSQRAVDPATAVRLGRTIAAKDIVIGKLGLPEDSSLHFETDIADVSTGRVSKALSGRGGVDQMFDAERQLVLKLFDQLGVKLTNAELVKLEQSPRTSTKAFVAYSAGVRAESNGDLIGAQAAYDRAIAIDPKFVPAIEHRAAVVGRAAKQSPSATASSASGTDPSRLDSRVDTVTLAVKPRAAKSSAGAGAGVVLASTTTSSQSSAPQSPAPSAPASAAASASLSPAGSPAPTASAKSVQAVSPSLATAASASMVPAAAAMSRTAPGAPAPTPSAAHPPTAIKGPALAKLRRDSIAAARRIARRDSVLAVAKQRADSMKAVRAARVAARRDSVRNAPKLLPAKRPDE